MSTSAPARNPYPPYEWEEVERDLDAAWVSFLPTALQALDTRLEGGADPYDDPERSLASSLDLFRRRQRAYHEGIEDGLAELRDVIADVRPRRARSFSGLREKAGSLLADNRGPNRVVKRTLDILIGSLALVVLAPCLVAIAIAVKLDSPGPVFYRAIRLGAGNVPFAVLRFRTTTTTPQESLVISSDDPRLTRVGRFLRHSFLNELPQLFNVLRGEMSLIGPRPLPPVDHSYYANVPEHLSDADEDCLWKWQTVRLLLKPGLTGAWVLHDPPSDRSSDWFRIDVEYFRNWSLRLDMKILAKTVVRAFRPQY
jgi:lipopolysaccharide/colanic/teichoic acid biosynthesis glycosyltransferase